MQFYTQGSSKDKANFIREIHNACHQAGFFYLYNHTIPSSLMNQILLLTRKFFALPQHEKEKININLSPCGRGYGKLEAEQTYGYSDYKETFDLAPEKLLHIHRDTQQHLRLIGPNQWPDHPSLLSLQFKQTILSYLSQMIQLGSTLMHAITLSLNYPISEYENYFKPAHDDAHAMLRLLHYPASRSPKLGVGAHVDSGFIAFLLQDETGGLQILNRDNQWIDVAPRENHFIVNIGEMLQSWSKHYYQATMHRVINHAQRDRVSAPFFFEPNLSSIIHTTHDNKEELMYGTYLSHIFERSFPA
jgi:isopenicillin N synthase-like dioxygenase